MFYPIPSSAFDDLEPIPLSPSELAAPSSASSSSVPRWIDPDDDIEADPLEMLVNDQDFVNSCQSSSSSALPLPVTNASNMSLHHNMTANMLQELEPTPFMEKIQMRQQKLPLFNMPTPGSISYENNSKQLPDKPKRPLSAYNIFFQRERKALLNSQGKVGFAAMAKIISAKWKTMEPWEKEPLTQLAKADSARYQREMKVWKSQQEDHERSTGVVSPLGFDQGIKTLDWSAFGAI